MEKFPQKAQVRDLVRLSSSESDRLEKRGAFPARVYINGRMRWRQSEMPAERLMT
jgi:predicted DNA-binding transcriptional regulator AlpA